MSATVQVFHPNSLTPASSADVIPVEDPATPGLGTIDVNHPGGVCWSGVTPDIRPGDTVAVTQNGVTDSTVVADVATGRVIKTAGDTVQVHGTAMDAGGAPLPLASLEHRLLVAGGAFLKNGRRTLRARVRRAATEHWSTTRPTTPTARSGRRPTAVSSPPT